MNINVQIEWIPNIIRVNNKVNVSNTSILKNKEIISKWYKKIWIENQTFGYKITDIVIKFEEFDNKILFVANFNLKTGNNIDFSLFNNPPLDGNEDKIRLHNIGFIKIDSFYIKNILISPKN